MVCGTDNTNVHSGDILSEWQRYEKFRYGKICFCPTSNEKRMNLRFWSNYCTLFHS